MVNIFVISVNPGKRSSLFKFILISLYIQPFNLIHYSLSSHFFLVKPLILILSLQPYLIVLSSSFSSIFIILSFYPRPLVLSSSNRPIFTVSSHHYLSSQHLIALSSPYHPVLILPSRILLVIVTFLPRYCPLLILSSCPCLAVLLPLHHRHVSSSLSSNPYLIVPHSPRYRHISPSLLSSYLLILSSSCRPIVSSLRPCFFVVTSSYPHLFILSSSYPPISYSLSPYFFSLSPPHRIMDACVQMVIPALIFSGTREPRAGQPRTKVPLSPLPVMDQSLKGNRVKPEHGKLWRQEWRTKAGVLTVLKSLNRPRDINRASTRTK